ncbi:hypothetical protein BSM4216_0635 [Bacillus smithii]|nr:hypothetical protein BSM4216_0635 [Bacillus smithii]
MSCWIRTENKKMVQNETKKGFSQNGKNRFLDVKKDIKRFECLYI